MSSSEAALDIRQRTQRPYVATIERNGEQVYVTRAKTAGEAWSRLAGAVADDSSRATLAEAEALLRDLGGTEGTIDQVSASGGVLTALTLSVRHDGGAA